MGSEKKQKNSKNNPAPTGNKSKNKHHKGKKTKTVIEEKKQKVETKKVNSESKEKNKERFVFDNEKSVKEKKEEVIVSKKEPETKPPVVEEKPKHASHDVVSEKSSTKKRSETKRFVIDENKPKRESDDIVRDLIDEYEKKQEVKRFVLQDEKSKQENDDIVRDLIDEYEEKQEVKRFLIEDEKPKRDRKELVHEENKKQEEKFLFEDDTPKKEVPSKKKSKTKRKWKLKQGPRIALLLLCIVGVWVFGAYLFIQNSDFSHDDVQKPKAKEKIKVQKEEVSYEAKVFMVGDALIHSSIYLDARQNDGSYDFKPMLQYIKPIASKYDLVYYNQETVLGGADLGYSNYPRFNTPDACGDAFIDAGFNMVSLATNHTMDKGEVGVLHSVQYWRSHPNVAASGQWSSYEDRTSSISKIYEVNHIKYAFISYTIWTNGLETPYGKDYLNNVYSNEKAKADIEAVRDKVDFVIVAMHWGTEYAWNVDWKQDEIANYLSNLGVDLIIGAHPHVVQTVEYINDGKTFVIYSLGNFISDQLDVDNYTGLAMEVTLKKHVGVDGSITNSVVEPKAELIYTTVTQRRGWSSDFRVKMYPTLTDSELRNHGSYYEKYKAIVNNRYPNLTWGLTWE